jgi:hypothetical protein
MAPAGPAHKVTLTSDFSGLTALLRNSFVPSVSISEISFRAAASPPGRARPSLPKGTLQSRQEVDTLVAPSGAKKRRALLLEASTWPGPSISFRASTGPKTAKTKRIFRQAKRKVSHRWRKPLKLLGSLNQSFRGIVCFQALNRRFVSPFSQHALSRPERAENLAIEACPRKAGVLPALRDLDSRLRGNDKTAGCDSM